MYQFTTTNIINSNLDSNGTTAKFAGTTAGLNVTRVGYFKAANIVSVHKRPYTAGVKEQATLTMPTTTAAKATRLTIDVRMSYQNTDSEYASTYLYFKKPIVVEIIATGTTDTDGEAFVTAINGLKDRFGSSYITASYNTGTNIITLVATDNSQRFYSAKFTEEASSYNSIIDPQYTDLTATFTISVAGKDGFGDDSWMAKAVRLSTLDNFRPFGITKEELPVIGGQYTQYTLRYSITKDGNDGIVAGGTSITTHVFYVLSTYVTAFEAAIANTTKVIDTIGLTVTAITVGTNLIDISNTVAAGATGVQLTYTSTTPTGGTGAVFALTGTNTVAGTLDATKISLSGSGIFTMATGHGIAAGDTIGISVTIDGVTQTADLTFQA